MMRPLPLLLAALVLPLAAAPASAQFQPGLRAPQNIGDGVFQSFLMGCYFAVSGRPANGLNVTLDRDGATLRPPTAIPDTLQGLIDTLDASVRVVVLDTPGGPVWTFFDPASRRCLIVPEPADAEGIEAELLRIVEADRDWRPVDREGGGRAFEQDFEANRSIRADAGRMRTWYQAAQGPALPQMIVVERVR